MRKMLITSAIILGATFVAFLAYMIYDPIRAANAKARFEEDSIHRGMETYAQYCTVCHGPLGEGCIGPALNTATNREGSAARLADRADYLTKVIARGRASGQPNITMPAWGIADGGQLTDKQIHDLVVFIQKGDFSKVPDSERIPPVNTQPSLPSAPGYSSDQLNEVKQLFQKGGCVSCHTIGAVGRPLSADLTDVGSRRTEEWLRAWIKDPTAMPAVDPNYKPGTLTRPSNNVGRGPNLWLATGQQPFEMGPTYMPKNNLTDTEIATIVRYLKAIALIKQ
jgi:mono/diheme cytochrome c family protein